MVSHVSASYRTGSNRDDDSPTFILARHKMCHLQRNHILWHVPTYKRSIIKYGKLSAKLSEETPWNKLCVDLTGLYKIRRKGRDNSILKAVTMIDPVTGWFKITLYKNKKATTIANLVETIWLVQYTWLVEIMYDRGGEFLGHKFKNSLI